MGHSRFIEKHKNSSSYSYYYKTKGHCKDNFDPYAAERLRTHIKTYI